MFRYEINVTMRPSVKEVKSFIVFHNHVNVMIYSALSSADDPLVIIQLMIAENFLLNIEKKICSALGRDSWILRARAHKFFSLYREACSAFRVDPKVDSPRPSAENFLLYTEKIISCVPGRGRSEGGFSAPERRNSTGGSSAEGCGRSTSGSCRYMLIYYRPMCW